MSDLHARLLRDVIGLLIRRVKEESAAIKADAYLEDMGYDGCPVCLANRRRESFA